MTVDSPIKESDKKKRQLEIQAALNDWRAMNTDRQWARLVADEHLVEIHYGVIHSNGMEECALGTILYVAKKDWVVTVKSTHQG
jgi:ATP:corrinoid adenosyltransferase